MIGNNWDKILQDEFEKPYFKKLEQFLVEEYSTQTIYPLRENIFNAFKFTPPEKLKVLLLGQDPYINENQAHGLAFSVTEKEKLPPSLKNIYKELESDLCVPAPGNGCLENWAKQGVMLLNTVLTVRAGLSNSHAKKGWETFTDKVMEYLGRREEPTAFILWGTPAQKKEIYITNSRHTIIKAPHPSPLSASKGFFGSKPFSAVNIFLAKNNLSPIKWN